MDETLTTQEGAPIPFTEEQHEKETKCPFIGGVSKRTVGAKSIHDWWPNQLNLKILHRLLRCRIQWARSSTTRRSSRPWTSMR